MTISLRIPEPDINPGRPLSKTWALAVSPRVREALSAAGKWRLTIQTPEIIAAPLDLAFAERRPASSQDKSRRDTLFIALALAALFHLLLIAPFVGVPGLMAPPPPPPPQEEQIGQDVPQISNLSVITEADLQNIGHNAVQQDAPPAPPTPTEDKAPAAEASPTPDTRPTPEKQASLTPAEIPPLAPPSPTAKDTQSSFDFKAFAAKASEDFSQDVKQAYARIEQRQKAETAKPKQAAASSRKLQAFQPAATHGREATAYGKSVLWALQGTVPEGNGIYGTTVVTFTVSADGKPEGLKIIKSSGTPWHDTAALLAVRQARLPIPSAELTPGDRFFQIRYIYLTD